MLRILMHEKRIKERNKSINAFTYTRFDLAYIEAKKLEERLEQGENLGVFAGVPFALKDFLPSKKGWMHSYGGVKCLVSVDEYDSLFCEVMEQEGGIAVGKTNAPSYGFSGTTDNKMYGVTSTPFNPLYKAGYHGFAGICLGASKRRCDSCGKQYRGVECVRVQHTAYAAKA